MLHRSYTLGTQRLLAPQVFDDKGQFGEWFGETIGKEGPGGKDSWLETEKRVVVINRLHQILEPFMLRRQVQDVEGKLPPKVGVGKLGRGFLFTYMLAGGVKHKLLPRWSGQVVVVREGSQPHLLRWQHHHTRHFRLQCFGFP